MSNKWKFEDEEDDDNKFERFRNRGKNTIPEEFRHEDNRKTNKPPRRRDEIEEDEG